MDVVVYQTSSLNNVLTRMGASLARALQALGVGAVFYGVRPGETAADTVRALSEAKTRAAIGFASGGAEWRNQHGQSVYDAMGCAFIGWDVDHPSYSWPRFSLPIARRGQVCASASHAAFTRAMGCQAASRLMLPGVDAVDAAPLPIAERPLHALAAMQWLGEPEVWWADTKGSPTYALVEGMVARMLADPGADLYAAFLATTAELGVEPALDPATCILISKVSYFVRQYDRLRLADALVAAGVPCAICGEGWRERFGEPAHLMYADNLDVEAVGRLYGHARVVFNINGANGASERAIQAMAAGAMVVSDYSPLLEESFGHGAAGFYDRRDMGGVAEMLALSADVQQQVADLGRSAVAASHLWTHKAAALVGMLRDAPFGIDVLPSSARRDRGNT
jgi:hypothetical protein